MSHNDFLEEESKAAVPSVSKKPMSQAKRITISFILIAVMAALGVFFPQIVDLIFPQSPDDAADSSSIAGGSDASWLSIETPRAHYSRFLSSVPGMPLRAVCENADALQFTVTSGRLLTKHPPDYKLTDQGESYTAASGDTVYYSPPDTDYSSIDERTIRITAIKDGSAIGYAIVLVRFTDDSFHAIEIESVSVSYGDF